MELILFNFFIYWGLLSWEEFREWSMDFFYMVVVLDDMIYLVIKSVDVLYLF